MTDVASREEEVLTLSEAAALLRVSEVTLYRWHRAGRGPARLRTGGRVLYSRSAIQAWLDGELKDAAEHAG